MNLTDAGVATAQLLKVRDITRAKLGERYESLSSGLQRALRNEMQIHSCNELEAAARIINESFQEDAPSQAVLLSAAVDLLMAEGK